MRIKSQYKAKGFLKNPHVQTILTQYLPYKPNTEFRHEEFTLSDGDFLELYFSGNTDKGLVIVLHGILGDIDSHYIAFSNHAFAELGLGGVFVVSRGARGANRTPKFFNAADTNDLNEVILYLRKRFPDIPLFAIGYSLGGVILTKWLADCCDNNPLTAAMAVSIPFDLALCVEVMSAYPGKIYSDYMVRNLRTRLLKKFQDYEHLVDLSELKKVSNFRQLDNLVTAPINGYTDANDYYAKGSPKNYLKKIKTPLLIIHALDDPLMRPEMVPNDADLSENVTLEVSENGGHLGFIADVKLGKTEYWLKERIVDYLSTFFQPKLSSNTY